MEKKLIINPNELSENTAIISNELPQEQKVTKPKASPKVTSQKPKDAPNSIQYLRDKHRQKVKGMFKFYEVPGGTLSFVFKEFKGDQIEKYTMVDGHVYEVPLGVAKHLNKNGWYPVHSYKQDDTGTHMRIGEKVHRFGFQSLDFIDLEESNSQKEIVTVERVF